MAYKWSAGKTAKVTFNVNTDEDGNIATNGAVAAGNTKVAMAGIKTESSFDQADAVFGAFVEGIVNGTYNKSTGKKTVEYFAEEAE